MRAALVTRLVSLAASASAAALESAVQPAASWSPVDAVITAAIAAQVFPGAVVGVLGQGGQLLYSRSYGHQVYAGQEAPLGGNAPVFNQSLWDMASLSKIMGATSASAVLYEAGLLDLDAFVAGPTLLGPAYAGQGKDKVRVRDLLMHQAGYPPDPSPGYADPAVGCRSATMQDPVLTFDCSETLFANLLGQTLENPVGAKYVYSDLSMITMQYIVGTLVAAHGLVTPSDLRPDCAGAAPGTGLYRTCRFEAFVRLLHTNVLGLTDTGFLPPPSVWPIAMPTYNDPTWRKRINQGDVSDENAYALGGIAGHAGVFTTLLDAVSFLQAWGYGTASSFVNATTRKYFMTAPNPTFSPRALGWDTQAATDPYQDCGNWSSTTAYHTGYTGTLMCFDPSTQLGLVLLTTRVYPNTTGNADAIQIVRQQVADAVTAVVGARLE
jgi:CubicO group peptidase (beta-lactamase class C family)